jgi:hypothetical protein
MTARHLRSIDGTGSAQLNLSLDRKNFVHTMELNIPSLTWRSGGGAKSSLKIIPVG